MIGAFSYISTSCIAQLMAAKYGSVDANLAGSTEESSASRYGIIIRLRHMVGRSSLMEEKARSNSNIYKRNVIKLVTDKRNVKEKEESYCHLTPFATKQLRKNKILLTLTSSQPPQKRTCQERGSHLVSNRDLSHHKALSTYSTPPGRCYPGNYLMPI